MEWPLEWPLHLWEVLREELTVLRKPTEELPKEPFDYIGRTKSYQFSSEDIVDISMLATQIAARKPELTNPPIEDQLLPYIKQLEDFEKLAPKQQAEQKEQTEQAALAVLNELLKTRNLGEAFLNVPKAR